MNLEESNYLEFNYLIVDDSEIIRNQLSRSLASVCQENRHQYRLFQVGRNAQLNRQPLPEFPTLTSEPNAPDTRPVYTVYNAATYKLALRVLDIPDLKTLTVLCDLSIPADTEVGLLGFLEGLARRRLPVNLIFMSSDYQNRVNVEPLLKKGKAFFVEKGTPQWDNLPVALIERVTSFNYQHLTPDDYSTRTRSASAPSFIEQLSQATRQAETTLPDEPPLPVAVTPARPTVPIQPLPETAKATPATKTNLVDKLVSSMRELPGRAGTLRSSGTARLREIPDFFKKNSINVGLPGRKKKNPD